nr:hypothetical protein [Novosphingobium sp. THN1]
MLTRLVVRIKRRILNRSSMRPTALPMAEDDIPKRLPAAAKPPVSTVATKADKPESDSR